MRLIVATVFGVGMWIGGVVLAVVAWFVAGPVPGVAATTVSVGSALLVAVAVAVAVAVTVTKAGRNGEAEKLAVVLSMLGLVNLAAWAVAAWACSWSGPTLVTATAVALSVIFAVFGGALVASGFARS